MVSPSASPEERQEWYDAHPSSADIPTFLLGLRAKELEIPSLNKTFQQRCKEGGIWESPQPGKRGEVEDVYERVANQIVEDWRATCEERGVPIMWVREWLRVMVEWSVEDEGMRDWWEPDESARVFKPGIFPLYHMTFVLTVDGREKIEIVASRCLPSGMHGDHPSAYRLDFFKMEMEEMLRERGIDSEGDLWWLRNGKVCVIEGQHDFELAIVYLYNSRASGWALHFSLGREGTGPGVRGPVSEALNNLTGKGKGKERATEFDTEFGADQIRPAEEYPAGDVGFMDTGIGGFEDALDDTETNIDDTIRTTWNWGRDALSGSHRAEQRVQAAKKKEREKEQGESRQRLSSFQRSLLGGSSKPVALTTSKNISSNQVRSHNIPLGSTSSVTAYKMSNKERKEKVLQVRTHFLASEMPGWQAAEEALIATRGDVDQALIRLGGKPKETSLRSAPESNTQKAGKQHRATASQPNASRSGSNFERNKEPEPNIATQALAGPSNYGAPGRSFPQRVQEAPQAAGKRISLSRPAPRHDTGAGTKKSPLPKPANESKKGLPKPAKESKKGLPKPAKEPMPVITKIIVYTSGGNRDDAFDPLETIQKPDQDIESDENEEGDRPVKKPKDAISLLKELQNTKELTQLAGSGEDESDSQRWLDCCRLFQIDPNKTGKKERVRVVGLKRPLFQYQAFAVYWQMLTSRKFGGGFVADMPGLGKTLTFLALLVVERQLCILWNEVNRSRGAKDGKHLPATGQFEDDVCPSQRERPGWIACPCTSSSPTSRMQAKPGVRIAIVPVSLMSNWREQWKEHIDDSREDLAMQLLLAHQESVAYRTDTSQMADFAANVSALRANKVVKAPDSAREGQERFFVLTTAKAYDAWIDKFKYGGPRTTVVIPELNVLRTKFMWARGGFKYNIQFGIACVDESHEEYTINKGRAGVLARLPGNPWCWGYSGTPFDKSPRCLEGVLYALEKQAIKTDQQSLASGWAQNEELKPFKREVFDRLCKDFEHYVRFRTSNADALDGFVKKFSLFISTFMIRRTTETQWFGHSLVALKPSFHRDIVFAHNEEYDEEIKALTPEIEADIADRLQKLQALWDNTIESKRTPERPTVLGFNNSIHAQYKLRILATAPALIRLTTGENALTLKTDELKQWRSHLMLSPYEGHIDDIFFSSPKLLYLADLIEELDRHKDMEGREEKMIIVTNFNCIAFIVKLMFDYLFPLKRGRVALLHAEMSTRARTTIFEAFTDATTEGKHGVPIRKQKKNYQFLIGTTPLLSKGLQLTRASTLVLMEPDHEFFRELQGYARINRIGQKNPETYTYRLIDEGSEIEMSILKRQAERGEFPGLFRQQHVWERRSAPDDEEPISESEVTEYPYSHSGGETSGQKLAGHEPSVRRKSGLSDLRSASDSGESR